MVVGTTTVINFAGMNRNCLKKVQNFTAQNMCKKLQAKTLKELKKWL